MKLKNTNTLVGCVTALISLFSLTNISAEENTVALELETMMIEQVTRELKINVETFFELTRTEQRALAAQAREQGQPKSDMDVDTKKPGPDFKNIN